MGTATACSQRSPTCALKPHLCECNRVTRRASLSRRNTFERRRRRRKKTKPTQNKMKFNTKFRPPRSDAIPWAYVPVTSRFFPGDCGSWGRLWLRRSGERVEEVEAQQEAGSRASGRVDKWTGVTSASSERSLLAVFVNCLTGRLHPPPPPHLFIVMCNNTHILWVSRKRLIEEAIM